MRYNFKDARQAITNQSFILREQKRRHQMAQKRTKRRTEKKASSRFYVVRSIQDIRKNMTARVEDYHQEFIKDPIQSGKEIMEEFREDPRKAMDSLVDDGRRICRLT
jgi:peptide methionine sulfoxide reductase MsrA